MRNRLHFFLFLALSLLLACSQEGDIIMTVNGPIPASEMGTTLTHEHVLVDFIGADSTGYHRWDKEAVVARVAPYLNEIKDLQVNTLVECTPAYLGRDPRLLLTLAEQTGLNLVTNTGYYGAHQNRFLPALFHQMDASEIAAIWIDEYEHGIEGSGVRPGFIKIAVDANDKLSEVHRKIITAASLAHQKTGLVIASHTGPDGPAFEQISVLESHYIDPSAFIWVHAQRGSLEGNIKAATMGAWISLDNVDLSNISWYTQRILELKKAGMLHRVLISHDAGWYKPGKENGGEFRGFTVIFTDLIPALRELAFSEQDLDQILIENPRMAFCLK